MQTPSPSSAAQSPGVPQESLTEENDGLTENNRDSERKGTNKLKPGPEGKSPSTQEHSHVERRGGIPNTPPDPPQEKGNVADGTPFIA